MVAVESNETALHQRMTETISSGGELVRDGRVYFGIIALVIALLEQLEVEYFHHVLT